jgi:8-oxo-dGTP diphosphatase
MKYVKVAAHGLIKKDNKFLITKRSMADNYMPGYWDIPGGTIKFQENIKDGLDREIFEETGLRVKIGRIIFCYDFPSGSERHQFQIVYECEYSDGEVTLNLKDHEEYKWVGMAELQNFKKIAFLDALYDYIVPSDRNID